MAKKQRLRFARGHEWGLGRATQTHKDRRHRRIGTRGARLRRALRDEGY
ncbi:hypothetical protein [Meiothermus sp.]|nr:hypothetical protein [Meiothermus sp.]